MLNHLLKSTAVVLVLSGAIMASAQDVGPQPRGQPDAQQPSSAPKPKTPPDAGPQPDGQVPGPNAARPEDRATAKNADTAAQPVPGAMPDSESVPSTISERNAEADKLITVAYTFRTLTDEQRAAIWQALKGQPKGKAFNAEVGNVLPHQVKLESIPQSVVQRAPQTDGYRFAVAGDRILLVSPISPIVVGVVKQ
jgi:hypothetical protein